LRGVAGNLGATVLERTARDLEAVLAQFAPARRPTPGKRAPPVTAPAAPVDFAAVAPMLAAVERALSGVVHALDRHFESAPLVRPAGAGDAGAGQDAAEAIAALRKLQSLLAEFNGDSTDYFDSSRPALATLLSAATMDRLAGHMAHYDFAAASQLLAAAVQQLDPA
jgi:hypothetical protein